MSFAFVFPGQGSQSVGMLGALATAESAVRATFDEASRALGFDLWKLVGEGREEALDATERTQPAMLAAGVAVWRVWRARGGALPEVVCGHSLGEFTALVCAEGLPFGATVELVRFRGQVMQEAVPAGSGAMAAIIGLDDEAIEAACREAAQGAVVEAANFNGAAQVVIAGEKAAVQRAIEAARARGARRAVALPVSVPSHTSLMRGAAERLRERLHSLEVRAPRIRYVSAVAQVIECGPGKVLTGLNRRIERRADLDFLALEDPASIDAALAATRGSPHA